MPHDLFTEYIESWADWARVYQSIPAFEPMIRCIFRKEGLPPAAVTHLTPGTNAVFRVGGYVIKIYAPASAGFDQSADRQTELFAAAHAQALGVKVPDIVAHGVLNDRYPFAYLIMRWIEGRALGSVLKTSDPGGQLLLGRRLRRLTDAMNVPCPPFNDVDVIADPERSERWLPYREAFRAERQAYIGRQKFGTPVFSHGDLCADNILVRADREPVVIDFADAVLAPPCYEQALIAFEYRDYPAFLRGYWEGENLSAVAERVWNGILIHDFGGDIIKNTFPQALAWKSTEELQAEICRMLAPVFAGAPPAEL